MSNDFGQGADVIPHSFCFEMPYESDTPIFIRGEGSSLLSKSGETYLDALSGVFVTSFGYSCREIIESVLAQYERLPFSPPLHGANEVALSLADEIVDFAGPNYDCVKFVNGGSESIELAIRLARSLHAGRGHGGRLKTISFYNSYHGSTQGSISLTGRADTWVFGPRVPGTIHVWPPDSAVFDGCLSDEELTDRSLRLIEHTICTEGPESIAAVIVEPVIHLAGMLILDQRFLSGLRDLCSRFGILLIFDEVVTGFGRTGSRFASHRVGVHPDLLCFGKGVSAGYAPLAGVLMSPAVSSFLRKEHSIAAFAPSHTYSSNPIGAAAGLAALRLLRDGDWSATVANLGLELHTQLATVLPDSVKIRSVGMLCCLKLPLEAGKAIERLALKAGVIIRGQADWVVIAPPFIVSAEEIARIVDVVSNALNDLERNVNQC